MEEETSKIETIEIGKTETKTDLEEKEEIISEKIIETLTEMEIFNQEITVITEASKIKTIKITEKMEEETSKIETTEIEKIEIKTDLDEKEETASEKITEALIEMEILNQEMAVITEVSKIEIEIIKVVQETLEIDRTIEDFLIKADLIRTEMTLEETAEVFLMLKRSQHLKFLQQQ